MDILLIIFGIIALYYGGEVLVRGSVGLSLRHGLSPMIIGLTVMAFGTSAPELVVSVKAALSGHGNLAFGNVVGSNIANILLILGVPAMAYTIATQDCESRRPWFEMMFATLLFTALAYSGRFGFWQGATLLLAFIMVLFLQFRRAKHEDAEIDLDIDEEITHESNLKIWLLIFGGVILLPLGAQILVMGAISIAQKLGVSEAVIGLTIVAIGTSLPELAASITAARKGETEMALGNVLGSNLFNLLLILSATGLLSTNQIDPEMLRFHIPFMVLTSLAMGLFVFLKLRISRAIGLVMVLIYSGYIAYLL